VLENGETLSAMTRRTFILCAIVAVLSVTSTAAATHALITSKDIKNGTIQPVDLSPAAKKAMRGKAGPQGPAGPTGLQGPAGFATVADANSSTMVDPGFGGTTTATCSTGKAVGGGYDASSSTISVYSSKPSGTTGWEVRGYNSGAFSEVLYAWVVCAG
jgi:hypothetical protein